MRLTCTLQHTKRRTWFSRGRACRCPAGSACAVTDTNSMLTEWLTRSSGEGARRRCSTSMEAAAATPAGACKRSNWKRATSTARRGKLPGDPKCSLTIGGKDDSSYEGTIESDKTALSSLTRVKSKLLEPRYIVLTPPPVRTQEEPPTAGIYVLVKPELRYGKKAELGFGGSAATQARVNFKVALTLRGGFSGMKKQGDLGYFGLEASLYGGAVLEADATCSAKATKSGLQVGSCKMSVKGYVPIGIEFRAASGKNSTASAKCEVKPLSGEFLQVSFDSLSFEGGLKGLQVVPGKDLQAFIDEMKAPAEAGETDPRTCAVGPDGVANQEPKVDDHRHVVKPNETLVRIATMKLGDGRRATEIARLNGLRVAPGAQLEPGTVLKLPTKSPLRDHRP